MNTLNSLETNTARQLLTEIIAEMKTLDDNLTKMEELLFEIEKKYNDMDEIIESLKKQIK